MGDDGNVFYLLLDPSFSSVAWSVFSTILYKYVNMWNLSPKYHTIPQKHSLPLQSNILFKTFGKWNIKLIEPIANLIAYFPKESVLSFVVRFMNRTSLSPSNVDYYNRKEIDWLSLRF